MTTQRQLKSILRAVDRDPEFQVALHAAIERQAAAAGLALSKAERRAFRLSSSVFVENDGDPVKRWYVCASKGCKTFEEPEQAGPTLFG